LMNINSCILYFCKFTRKCPIVKPNNNSVFSFSSTQQAQEGGEVLVQKKIKLILQEWSFIQKCNQLE